MNIKITENAINYIKENGDFVTIRHSKNGWCHTGNVDVPKIHLGKPDGNLEDYNLFYVNELNIYITKDLKLAKDEIIIDLAKLFKYKKLTLEGTLVSK